MRKYLNFNNLCIKTSFFALFFKENLSNVLFLKTLCFIFAASNGEATPFQVNSKFQRYD